MKKITVALIIFSNIQIHNCIAQEIRYEQRKIIHDPEYLKYLRSFVHAHQFEMDEHRRTDINYFFGGLKPNFQVLRAVMQRIENIDSPEKSFLQWEIEDNVAAKLYRNFVERLKERWFYDYLRQYKPPYCIANIDLYIVKKEAEMHKLLLKLQFPSKSYYYREPKPISTRLHHRKPVLISLAEI